MSQTGKIIDILNQNENINLDHPKKIKAYQLNQPFVKVQGTNIVKNHGDGSMNIRDKLRNSTHFKDWVIVYSCGKNPKYDDQDADGLVSLLCKSSSIYGVKFDEPGFITCDSKCQDWKQQLGSDIEKNGKPQIVVLFFSAH